jgi:uncharacterized protein (TIGR02271 family)
MAKTVVGLFDNFNDAQNALRQLEDTKFDKDDISLIANNAENQYGNQWGTNTASGVGSTDQAATGVSGNVDGLVSNMQTCSIPGIGEAITAGPLAKKLGDNEGVAKYNLTSILIDLNVPENDANYYVESVRRGGTLLEMKTSDDRAQQAADIMDANGAINAHHRFEQYQTSGFSRFDENAQPYTRDQIEAERQQYAGTGTSAANAAYNTGPGAASTAGTANTVGAATAPGTGEEATFPVIQEEANIDKRPVQSGGVRVYSHMTEEPVDQEVNLRQENVTVERRPVDRPATQQDLQAFKEGELEVRETSEEPVISKQARVVEEVAVNKDAVETTQPVHTTVRKSDVEVQNLDQEETLEEDANLTDRQIADRQL